MQLTKKSSAAFIAVALIAAAISTLVLRNNTKPFGATFNLSDHYLIGDIFDRPAETIEKSIENGRSSGKSIADSFMGKSIEEKTAKEIELNKLAMIGHEIFSQKKLYEDLVRRGANIDVAMANRMKTESMAGSDWEMLNAIMGAVYSDDENFNIELKQYNNFKELKAAVDSRSKKTGTFYGTQLLNELMAYKGATFAEIKELLDAGAVLPEEAMNHIVWSGNIDLAVQLKQAGYNIDVNFYDKFSSMNALEQQAFRSAINPYSASSEEQIAAIKKLAELGIPLKINDNTRDSLDWVLESIPNNLPDQATKLFELAKYLHEVGLPLEQSHRQLLEKIKTKYPDIYAQYANNFE